MKKISIYVKDLIYNPSSYYRILQYTNKMSDFTFLYHPQLSEGQYKKYMPISKQNILLKIFLQVVIYFKMLFALISDKKEKVDVVVISRRIINRFFPSSYKVLLKKMKKDGTKIFWDFDDHIIISKEVTRSGFDFLSEISDRIIVTHEYLKCLVKQQYTGKVVLLPTTDGDVNSCYNCNDQNNKNLIIEKEIRFVWVGTSGNLKYLLPIIPLLDEYAGQQHKKIILKIVCNEKVEYDVKHLILESYIWTRDLAVQEILISHIGLMPLTNSDFAKGKGGFKLIQYLSGALPIIGSNIGFNKEVCDNTVGKLVDDIYDKKELFDAIDYIVNRWDLLSSNALSRWYDKFNFNKNFEFWKKILEGK